MTDLDYLKEVENTYWENFYATKPEFEVTDFAKFCLPLLKGKTIEFGCGNGRDLYFLLSNGVKIKGVDSAFESPVITKQDIGSYIKENESPENVYARFFWHSITDELRLEILKWTKNYIFIEARTLEDIDRKKTYNGHYRNYVDVDELVKQLEDFGFLITHKRVGCGMATYKKEDPHVVRIVACRNSLF